jgi:hypothetical protein
VEIMEVWKQIGEAKELWVNKVGIVTLLTIEWKELDNDASIEFLNTFVIKDLIFILVGGIYCMSLAGN